MNSTLVSSFDTPVERYQLISYALVGGGFFTGRYSSPDDVPEAGSRFDPNKTQGKVTLFDLHINLTTYSQS